jgi:hypothetical protein
MWLWSLREPRVCVGDSLDDSDLLVTLIKPEVLRPDIYNVPSVFILRGFGFHPEANP